MITHYYRPQTLEEALTLLSVPNTRPLAGGTILSHSTENFAAVDLQSLELDKIRKSGDHLEIGATVRLQSLLESTQVPKALKSALKLELPLNLRNMGSVTGTLILSDGRSPFATVMVALDAKISFSVLSAPHSIISHTSSLSNFLLSRPDLLPGKIITTIKIPLAPQLAFETVARTPDDKPIVCVALARWPSGRCRLVLGGWGHSPTVALDGTEPSIDTNGIALAVHNAAHDATDQWASAEYRSDVAAVLANRCMETFHL
jgi:CO/xanthine dehydrogenase FAD-binding subunit